MMIQSRRRHKKSRKGCRGCKERRIKCDESGPPCANCAVRKHKCEYGYFREQPTSLGISGLPAGADGRGGPDWQTLELELIHHYTTQTWKCFKSIPQDTYLQQTLLPRIGLTKHRFLLNGILAVAALDMARLKRKEREQPQPPEREEGSSKTKKREDGGSGVDDIPKTRRTEQEYLRASRLFYTAGSEGFRAELSKGPINGDNAPAIFFFSFGAAIINLAMRIPRRSPAAHRAACFALAVVEPGPSSSQEEGASETRRRGREGEEYAEDDDDDDNDNDNNNHSNNSEDEDVVMADDPNNDGNYHVLDRIDLLFNLLLGTGTVQAIAYDLLRRSEIWPAEGMAAVPTANQADELLDTNTKAAFERLWTLRSAVLRVDLEDASAPPAPIEQDLDVKTPLEWEACVSESYQERRRAGMVDPSGNRVRLIRGTRWRRYKVAILGLERFFAEDARGTTQGMALGWPWACGPVFVEDVRTREPFALLLLVHWAVLMMRMEVNARYWWAEGVGRGVVHEASRILVEKRAEWTGGGGRRPGVVVVADADKAMVDDLWMQSINWARLKVGLDPLQV